MAYRALADFLEELEPTGELVRIAAEVDPALELPELTQRVARDGGPALLFLKLKGCRTAAVSNLLATERRICRALAAESLDEIAGRLQAFVAQGDAATWLDRLRLGSAPAADRWQPKLAKSGACQQVVRLASDVNLTELPAVQTWPGEPGQFIHGGQSFTANPTTGQRGVGRYEIQVLDANRLAVMWDADEPAARHLSACREKAERMPIAVALGGDPVYPLMTADPLATLFDPLVLAGVLRGAPVELIKCRTVDLRVPADADVVIEGYIDPTEEPVNAGPIGLPSGHYSGPIAASVMHVTAITERTTPIVPLLMPAHQQGERRTMRRATQRMFRPIVRLLFPDIVDYSLDAVAAPQQVMFVAIEKSQPFQARRVASALWGWPPTARTKLLILVDADVDVLQSESVWSAIGANVHPGRDVFFHQAAGPPLDHAAPAPGAGHAMAIDATTKLPGEHPLPWPPRAEMSEEIRNLVTARWPQYGVS